MKQRTSFAILATGLLLAAGQASAVTITFDDLDAGTTLSNQYAALGAVFSPNAFSGAGSSTSGQDWATNTDMTIADTTGTDVGNLGTPSLVSGNILHSFSGWFNEDGDPSFMISFSTPITSFSATFAGVNEPADVHIFAYNGGTLLAGSPVTGTVTTGQYVLSFSAATITSVIITPGSYDDWVGVDNITFTQAVPEAGTWAMMSLGMGLLALRRRQTS